MATYKEILKDLKSKQYQPIYLLMGEESYFIDQISDYISEHVLNEAEKSFNQTVLYGKETDAAAIINTAKRFPMMSEHQVVVVKEAQQLKKIEDLIHYAEQPLNSTLLVLNYKYGKLAKNKKLYKSIAKSGVVLESNTLYENQVADWVQEYIQAQKKHIEPKASALLIEHVGADLSKLVQAVDKLLVVLGHETLIKPEHIEQNIGVSKDYNIFELQKAISQRNTYKAYQIIDYFNRNPKNHPFVLTIGALYNYFNKLFTLHFLKDKSKQSVAAYLKVHPFFVQEYIQASRIYSAGKVAQNISHLRTFDMKSKGFGNVSNNDAELLRELIYKLMH